MHITYAAKHNKNLWRKTSFYVYCFLPRIGILVVGRFQNVLKIFVNQEIYHFIRRHYQFSSFKEYHNGQSSSCTRTLVLKNIRFSICIGILIVRNCHNKNWFLILTFLLLSISMICKTTDLISGFTVAIQNFLFFDRFLDTKPIDFVVWVGAIIVRNCHFTNNIEISPFKFFVITDMSNTFHRGINQGICVFEMCGDVKNNQFFSYVQILIIEKDGTVLNIDSSCF